MTKIVGKQAASAACDALKQLPGIIKKQQLIHMYRVQHLAICLALLTLFIVALLFNGDDSDGSSEQLRRALQLLAKAMDTNGNKRISKLELKHYFVTLEQRYFEPLVMKQWISHTSGLPLAELCWQRYSHHTAKMLDEYAVSGELRRERLRWLAADMNGDNCLNYTEFQAFIIPDNYVHMRPTVVQEAMRLFDKNRDKQLSYDELAVAMQAGSATGGPENQGQSRLLDKQQLRSEFMAHSSKKGMNMQQLTEWMTAKHFDYFANAAEHILSSFDANQNGQLSRYELLSQGTRLYEFLQVCLGDDLLKLALQ